MCVQIGLQWYQPDPARPKRLPFDGMQGTVVKKIFIFVVKYPLSGSLIANEAFLPKRG